MIKKVVVTGEEVDIHLVFPFESSPQVINRSAKEPEGDSRSFLLVATADDERTPGPQDRHALRSSSRKYQPQRRQPFEL